MTKRKVIAVQDHWVSELSKIRCWIDGFKEGRGGNTLTSRVHIPGEDTLRQIQVAIQDAKP